MTTMWLQLIGHEVAVSSSNRCGAVGNCRLS